MNARRTGLCDLLLPDETGQRALQETLADWRDERSRAGSAVNRARTDLRGCMSMLRVGLGLIRSDLARRDVWHAFAWTLGLALVLALVNPTLWTYALSSLHEFEFDEATAVIWLLIPSSLSTAFLFASASGFERRSGRDAPVLATTIVSFAFMLVLIGWITPAANQAFRTRVWMKLDPAASVANGHPAAGVSELALPELLRRGASDDPSRARAARGALVARFAILLAVPTSFLIGVAIRARCTPLRSRWLAQVSGPVVLVGIVLAGGTLSGIIVKLMEGPTATLIGRLHLELWVILSLGWIVIVGLSRVPRARNRMPEP